MGRLTRLLGRHDGGLAVVWGRRRVGKTRLLLEWESKNQGVYLVGDQSSETLQRSYVAQSLDRRFPGFASVTYPTWTALLERLSTEALATGWKGPLIVDEFPYFAGSSPELPSQFQRWIDHEARRAGIVVALSGSSQRMMQGLVLNHDAPPFGRAQELLDIQPLEIGYLSDAFPQLSSRDIVNMYTIVGGIPRYWELASDYFAGDFMQMIDNLILDPYGPLHNEPDRLLLEEIPPAISLRPVLDSIGLGAYKPSEIAARSGMAATSLSKPFSRLMALCLINREVAFGESEKSGKRALYKLRDPFMRLWFRVVAPNKSLLMESPPDTRIALYRQHHPSLSAAAWEELCRKAVPRLHTISTKGSFGPWGPARRYWHRNEPELDILAESADGKKLLIGECKWVERDANSQKLEALVRSVTRKQMPRKLSIYDKSIEYALFVNNLERGTEKHVAGITVFDADDVLGTELTID